MFKKIKINDKNPQCENQIILRQNYDIKVSTDFGETQLKLFVFTGAVFKGGKYKTYN